MKKIFILSLLSFSLTSFASSQFHFEFNITNINALVGMICFGEGNMASNNSAGAINSEQVVTSSWKVINYGGKFEVTGECNSPILKKRGYFTKGKGLPLDITFDKYDIEQGQTRVTGNLGNAEVYVDFESKAGFVGGVLKDQMIVKSLAIAPGIGGARATGMLSTVLNRISPISSKNATMSFCNVSSGVCRNVQWENSYSDNLNYLATGAGWLMNFGLKKVGSTIYLNAAKVIDMRGTYRVPSYSCGSNSCGASVVLQSQTTLPRGCTHFTESGDSRMTQKECMKIFNEVIH